jgi:hypothetical protein
MHSKIKSCFWSDPVVEDLPSEGKLALLWLFTSRISVCGWVPTSRRRFEFETASPWQALLSAAEALGKGLVIHDKGFWVRSYIRHQFGVGERLGRNNMRVTIIDSMAEVPEEVKVEIVKEYPQLKQALAKPLASPTQAPPKGKEKEKEQEQEQEGSVRGGSGETHPAGVNAVSTRQQLTGDKRASKHFVPPPLAEWTAYASSLNPAYPPSDAEQAWNHYEANGWRVGRNPMKDWKAACRTCRGRWLSSGGPQARDLISPEQPTRHSANPYL